MSLKKTLFDRDWSWIDEDVSQTIDLDITIPNGLYLLWSVLWPLHKKYDIKSISGRVGLIAWWLFCGKDEFKGIEINIEDVDKIFEVAIIATNKDSDFPISMIALEMARLDDKQWDSLDLSKIEDRRRLLGWYFTHVAGKILKITPSESNFLSKHSVDIKQDIGIPITRAMSLCLDIRPDLQKNFDISTPQGRRAYLAWWLNGGYRDFAPNQITQGQLDALSESDPQIGQDIGIPITRAMSLCLDIRPDLQKNFDISTPQGRRAYLAWWLNGGYRDFAPNQITQGQLDALSESDPQIGQDIGIPITRAMSLCLDIRPDLQKNFDISTPQGRRAYLAWWLNGGYRDFAPNQITQGQLDALSESDPQIGQDIGIPITRAMSLCLDIRPDLQKNFDISTPQGRRAYLAWWLNGGYRDFAPNQITQGQLDALSESDPQIGQDIGIPITRAMSLCLDIRPDLQKNFDISTPQGRRAYLAWWLNGGYRDFAPNQITQGQLDALSESDPQIGQDIGIPITRAMSLCLDIRPDLQKNFDISTPQGRRAYLAWWLNGGYRDFAPNQITQGQLDALSESDPQIGQDIGIPITRAMSLCLDIRPDLQKNFDISTPQGRRAYLAWWLNGGYRDFAPNQITQGQLDALSESDPQIGQDIGIPITRAMSLCLDIRPDLQKNFDISTPQGRRAYLAWWLNGGYRDFAPNQITQGQLDALSESDPQIKQDIGKLVIRDMTLCWWLREDLKEAFDLNTTQGRKNYIHWWEIHGENESLIQNRCFKKRTKICNKGSFKSGGVNLIGLVKGELGIGEDARMAARAMKAAGVPFSIFNFPPSCSSREKDHSLAHLINDNLVYNVNLVCLTGFEHSRLLTQIGIDVFDGRFTIGAWPWELPKWPVQCEMVFKLVDEIWASSKYTEKAYSNAPVRVIHMPMTVDFDLVKKYMRSDFDLPENAYIFLFVFDGLSYMARKNPIAHIKSFCEAFHSEKKDVGLVVKTMNIANDNEIWKEFHRMADKDERIHVYGETFTKDRVLGLMNCCDAFLSLHRAEGFGRCIAEMMWLGKPVIVTNFSGNTDFTTMETAFLVDGSLIPVKKDEYPFGEGQQWCEPDIGHAAEQMRKCYEDRAFSEKISKAGQNLIKCSYSDEVVGLRYKTRLGQLGLI